MSEIKLFIATSIDGYIARENGSLDWLPGSGSADALSEKERMDMGDGGYGDFMANIDLIVIGRKTYIEILGFGIEWPYPNVKTYVVSSDVSYQTTTKNTKVIHELDIHTMFRLKAESQKNIWLMGGGKIISQFLHLNMIDTMTLSIVPIILGKGIKLFVDGPPESKFELAGVEKFGSLANLSFRKKL